MSVRKTNTDLSDISGVIADRDSVTAGITAFAGGGQASAVLLTTSYNRVSTVASAGDSVKLPAALPGSRVYVFNKSATSMNLFPSTGDNINALADDAAFAMAAGAEAIFLCMVSGTWDTILGA
jgi:hypothetical protein